MQSTPAERPEPDLSRLATRFQCERGVVHMVVRWRVTWSAGLLARPLTEAFNLLAAGTNGAFAAWEPPREAVFTGATLNRRCLDLLRVLQAVGDPRLAAWLADAPAYASEDEIGCACLDEFLADLSMSVLRVLSQLFGPAAGASPPERASSALSSLARQLKSVAASTHVAPILMEARAQGIPVVRVVEQLPVYQLGHGARRRLLWRGFTSRTPHASTILSTHKHLAMQLFRQHGFPVPDGRVVDGEEDACATAAKIGFPVVVKPTSKDMGVGVVADIRDQERLRAAYRKAKQHGAVLVEKHVAGEKYRLLVLNGHCRGGYRTVPAHVIGDGERSISQLIDDGAPARAAAAAAGSVQGSFEIDGQYLGQQGFGPDSVPSAGQMVLLSSIAQANAGGKREFIDLSGVHPDNLRMAEEAAELFGIDLAGVDLITTDISRPPGEAGAVINEINVTPALPFSEAPKWILDDLFPGDGGGRIRISVLIGELSEAEESRTLQRFFAGEASAGRGCLLNRRLYLDGRRNWRGRTDTPRQVRTLLAGRGLSEALVHLPLEEFRRHGLPAHYLSALMVNLPGEHAEEVLGDPSVAGLCARWGVVPVRGFDLEAWLS